MHKITSPTEQAEKTRSPHNQNVKKKTPKVRSQTLGVPIFDLSLVHLIKSLPGFPGIRRRWLFSALYRPLSWGRPFRRLPGRIPAEQ